MILFKSKILLYGIYAFTKEGTPVYHSVPRAHENQLYKTYTWYTNTHTNAHTYVCIGMNTHTPIYTHIHTLIAIHIDLPM